MIYHLGRKNTEDYFAAKKYLSDKNLESHDLESIESLEKLFEQIKNTQSSLGIVPIENKNLGVNKYIQDYLALYKSSLNILEYVTLSLNYSLVSISEDLSFCSRVYIPKHLKPQISDFLGNINLMEHIEVNDILESIENALSEKHAAAITLLETSNNYTMNTLDVNISNGEENWTKYAVIGK